MSVVGETAVLQCQELAKQVLPDESEDVRLWRAVQSGDHAAFDALVVRHCAKVSSVTARLLRNPSDVEEVVQETFVRAFETRRRYPQIQCFRAWLLRIAINLCRSRQRTVWWRRILLTGDYRDVPHPSQDARSQAEQALFQDRVARAVDELPETLRTPFQLRYFEELSGAEIALALGCNESTVWTRIYAARRTLRDRLALSPDEADR